MCNACARNICQYRTFCTRFCNYVTEEHVWSLEDMVDVVNRFLKSSFTDILHRINWMGTHFKRAYVLQTGLRLLLYFHRSPYLVYWYIRVMHNLYLKNDITGNVSANDVPIPYNSKDYIVGTIHYPYITEVVHCLYTSGIGYDHGYLYCTIQRALLKPYITYNVNWYNKGISKYCKLFAKKVHLWVQESQALTALGKQQRRLHNTIFGQPAIFAIITTYLGGWQEETPDFLIDTKREALVREFRKKRKLL